MVKVYKTFFMGIGMVKKISDLLEEFDEMSDEDFTEFIVNSGNLGRVPAKIYLANNPERKKRIEYNLEEENLFYMF
jgi:hypothetical protein